MYFIMAILLSWVKICHLRLRCVFLSVLVLEWSAILQVLCLSHQMESAFASIRPCSTDDWFLLSNRRGGESRRYFELLILISFNLFLAWQNGLVIYIPLPCQFCWFRFSGCSNLSASEVVLQRQCPGRWFPCDWVGPSWCIAYLERCQSSVNFQTRLHHRPEANRLYDRGWAPCVCLHEKI